MEGRTLEELDKQKEAMLAEQKEGHKDAPVHLDKTIDDATEVQSSTPVVEVDEIPAALAENNVEEPSVLAEAESIEPKQENQEQ